MPTKPIVEALAFDVFGTVADWRGTIAAEGQRIAGDAVDWNAFAVKWSKAYGESLAAMTDWTNLDVMLAASFYRLAAPTGLLQSLPLASLHELATTWSRLKPWPDAATGFDLLKGRYTLAAFTNANHAMLESLAKSTGLPWSCLLSAETDKEYKPDSGIYLMALRELCLPPEKIMLVASHTFDLNAARSLGFKTALIARPSEPGSDPKGLDHEADIVASDLIEFAEILDR